MNNIREARLSDAEAIRALLEQLDYPKETCFLERKLTKMLNDDTYKILVYEFAGKVIALMTIHYYWQLAYQGETATIGFFVVDSTIRSRGIGKAMEEYCTNAAKERNCALIEVYSSARRTEAHPFYERQGYIAYEKFFIKEINEKA